MAQPTSGNQRFCSVGCGGKIGPYQPRERPEAEPASEPAPTPSKQMNAAKERVRLYKELLAFITEGKGWVTSEPGCSPLRFESIDARLAGQLRDAGHKVSHVGQGERLTGNAGFQKTRDGILHYAGIVPVHIFELPVGGEYQPPDYRGGYTEDALISFC